MSGKRNTQGYIFISVLVLVVILSISMGVLTKSWAYRTKRMKENELLFRGKQYARAILNFYQIHKRYPFTLEELEKSKPRLLRKPWKDPMTKDGEWGLVHLSDLQSGRLASEKNKQLKRLIGAATNAGDTQSIGQEGDQSTFGQKPEETGIGTTRGQIVGVYSRSRDVPFLNYQKGEIYSDWKFMGIMNRSNALRRMSMGAYLGSSKEAR